MLNLKKCITFRAPFNRPNLFYEVRPKPDSQEECAEEIREIMTSEFKNQSGIIYTLTIKDVDTLSNDLRSKGLRVAPYHAMLESQVRYNKTRSKHSNQTLWHASSGAKSIKNGWVVTIKLLSPPLHLEWGSTSPTSDLSFITLFQRFDIICYVNTVSIVFVKYSKQEKCNIIFLFSP